MSCILRYVYPNDKIITYKNDKQINNDVLIRTLNIREWKYGHREAISKDKPYLCYSNNKNWYFIVLPDGTQITCHNPNEKILSLIN